MLTDPMFITDWLIIGALAVIILALCSSKHAQK